MIIKSKGMGIRAAKNLIGYVLREAAQLTDANGHRLLFTQHLRGKTQEEWAEEFAKNEATRKFRNKNARGLYHCILSMHPQDSSIVTLSMLEDIARQFVKLRCPESIVLCTAHLDAHIHLHMIISSVAFGGSGNSIRINKSQFKDVLKAMAEYQQINYPELKFSVVNLNRGTRLKDNEYQMRLQGKIPEKQLAIAYARTAYETSTTTEEFCENVRQYGFTPYFRNGLLIGISGNRKYRLSTLGIDIDKFLEIGLIKDRNR